MSPRTCCFVSISFPVCAQAIVALTSTSSACKGALTSLRGQGLRPTMRMPSPKLVKVRGRWLLRGWCCGRTCKPLFVQMDRPAMLMPAVAAGKATMVRLVKLRTSSRGSKAMAVGNVTIGGAAAAPGRTPGGDLGRRYGIAPLCYHVPSRVCAFAHPGLGSWHARGTSHGTHKPGANQRLSVLVGRVGSSLRLLAGTQPRQ